MHRVPAVVVTALTATFALGACSTASPADPAPSGPPSAARTSTAARGGQATPTRYYAGSDYQYSKDLVACLRGKGWEVTDPSEKNPQFTVKTQDEAASKRAGADMLACQKELGPRQRATATR